jgi:hypothetical protein
MGIQEELGRLSYPTFPLGPSPASLLQSGEDLKSGLKV